VTLSLDNITSFDGDVDILHGVRYNEIRYSEFQKWW